MGVTRQLYQLQELDQAIDAEELALKQKTGQLGESQTLVATRTRLASEQQRLASLKQQQQSAEWEADDLTSKIKVIDEKLYGGKIRNPKELTDLQHEGQALKAKRDQIESRVLAIMEQVESTEAGAVAASREFQRVEQEWQAEQQKLAVAIEDTKSRLTDLKSRRQQTADGIEPRLIELYERLRKQKGQALAKVEQGICRGCRISLSSNEIQQARSDKQVQCSSCGRILYLP